MVWHILIVIFLSGEPVGAIPIQAVFPSKEVCEKIMHEAVIPALPPTPDVNVTAKVFCVEEKE